MLKSYRGGDTKRIIPTSMNWCFILARNLIDRCLREHENYGYVKQSWKSLMWSEVIARRRTTYEDAQHLSDWQIHSAHLVSSAIKFTHTDIKAGPWFVPMPTGSGKTTGAIWGITELCEDDTRVEFEIS